jgi:hypothetical protein
MKLMLKFLFVIAVFVFGMANAKERLPENNDANRTLTANCPTENFIDFLNIFSENKLMQEKFTRLPLKNSYIKNDAGSEPIEIKEFLNFSQIKFPVIKPISYRKAHGWQIKIKSLNESKVIVFLGAPDTDFVVNYFFEKFSCWYLVEMVDLSL